MDAYKIVVLHNNGDSLFTAMAQRKRKDSVRVSTPPSVSARDSEDWIARKKFLFTADGETQSDAKKKEYMGMV